MKAETLKKAILQYAMQGKLVEQDQNDEPASVLLERIKAEKEQLIKDGKIKKEKPLPPITEDEIPYELPKGWEWVRIADLYSFKTGLSYKKELLDIKSNRMIRVLRGGNINNLKYTFKADDIFISNEFVKEELYLNKNYLITPSVTSLEHIGKFAYIDKDYNDTVVGGFVMMFLPHSVNILSQFFLYIFSSPYVREFMRDTTNKSGQAFYNISKEKLKALCVPVPPLAEQQRIVEKLEQILPLVEEYGNNEEKLSKLNSTLPDKIKQSILQHAVQGKLIPQNPSDEPASILLERIKAEKEQLIKDGKIKKEKPLPPITEDEIPFQIPDTWKWVRIGTITDVGTGTTPQTSNYEYYNGNVNWISSSSTCNDYITEPDKLISQKAVDECNLRIYNPDTLIIALYGQGKTRGQITQLKIPSCINQACAAICIINKELLNLSYIKYFYKKQYNDIRSLAAGGAQPNLNVQKIKNTLIPIPPLAEQQRIVTKVEELFSIVDKLNEH